MDYIAYTEDLEHRMQVLQKEYIATGDERALLLGPLLAVNALARNNQLLFARERYQVIAHDTPWKVADDMMLSFREEVECVLAGPGSFAQLKTG